MGDYYIFTNVLGSFVFDSAFKLVEKRDKEELLKKYKDVKEPDEDDLIKVLPFFKKHNFFSDFYKKNIELTKKSIKESVKKDLFVIQAIRNIEDIDKAANILLKGLREWYELYNPEFSKSISNNEKFVELVVKKNKKELLKEIKVNEADSMGAELSNDDLNAIKGLAKKLIELHDLRKKQQEYLEKLMKKVCPNITEITGVLIGAKLIEHAGSLKRLVEMPSSTIQLLGAEKALFRHMKTGAKCPRHGLIVEHNLIKTAAQKEHGKRARALADKISIAVKVDYFKGKFIGDKLKKELEAKFK